MKNRNLIKLILCILICLSAGFIGSLFTSLAVPTWYAALNKPAYNPPDWIFGPVWTALYIMMGVAFYLFWKKKARKAITIFIIQLALNTLWSILFFGLKSPFLALMDIILLWAFILATILTGRKFSKAASYLLVPYLLWVSYAFVLNASIWSIN